MPAQRARPAPSDGRTEGDRKTPHRRRKPTTHATHPEPALTMRAEHNRRWSQGQWGAAVPVGFQKST